MADDIDKKREAVQAEFDVNKQLLIAAKAHLAVSSSGLDIKNNLVKQLQAELPLAMKLQSIDTAINALLLEQVKTGTKINQKLIDRLDRAKELATLTEEEDTAAKAQNAFLTERTNILKDILGITSELELAVVNANVKTLMLNKAYKNITASATKMVDGFKSGVTDLGLTAESALQLQGNIAAASFSMTGFLYGSEAVAASGKAIVERYGNAAAATSEMIEGVTQLQSVTGGSAEKALDLAEAFKGAGVPATDVKDIIQDIATKQGISATKAMDGMGDSMGLLVGKSEEQLKTIIASNAALVKQGTNMAEIQKTSNHMLDIEGSMKAQAKARVMIGRDINVNGVRAAAIALEQAVGEDERAAASIRLNAEMQKGIGGQAAWLKLTEKQKEIQAAAYGQTKDEITQMLQKKKEQAEFNALSDSEQRWENFKSGAKVAGVMAGNLSIEMGKVVAQNAALNLMQGKGTGIGAMFKGAKDSAVGLAKGIKTLATGGGIGGLFGGDTKPDTPEIKPLDDGPAEASQGAGDGLKDLAEGLKAMADTKVFIGIGAVALAGPAFVIAVAAIPFLLFMGKIKLNQIQSNFEGLAAGLNAMSTTFVGAGATAVAGPALAIALPSIPFLSFMGLLKLKHLQKNFTSLATGLTAMSTTFVGSAATALAGPALTLAVLAIPFLTFMGKIKLKNLSSNFIQLGVGLTAMSPTFMGSLALAAFGVAALIAIPSLLFLAGIALLGAVGAAGLVALGTGLATLGGVAATGLPFLAIALIAALGLAMIPFAYALSLVTPLIEVFGNIIIGVLGAIPPIIAAVADGFVTMFSALTPEAILGMLALGPALMLAGVGMVAFAVGMAAASAVGFFGGGIMDDIGELTLMAPGLSITAQALGDITTNMGGLGSALQNIDSMVEPLLRLSSVTSDLANGLYSVAGGLAAFSLAGLLASPVIAGLSMLGAVAPALESLGEFFGMGGSSNESKAGENKSADNTSSALLEELKGLRSDIQSQPILINVDGKVISRISKVQAQQNNSRQPFQK